MKTCKPLGIMIFTAALLAAVPAVAWAEHHEEISNPDLKCLKCHSKNLKKKLEDGETMSLKVTVDEFSKSVHSVIGCTGCHRDVAKGKHPSRRPISSARDYSVKHNQTCQQCHETKAMAYEGSIHASLAADGNAGAPLCSDCHKTHAVESMAVYEPVTGEPCKACHEGIYDAYAESVHGQARVNGNAIRQDHVKAPICADCHRAHDVNAVAAMDHLKTTCLGCHEGAAVAHEQWLPNAGMHMDSVSCAACHSPMAERRIDLQLYDKLEQVPVGLGANHGSVSEKLVEIDAEGDGLDPVELWKLVRRTSEDGKATDVTLRGRMEVTTGVDAHRVAPRSEAVRSCESCHDSTSGAFDNVTVSISRPDGRKQRIEADKEVLSSAISVDSIGGFYAPGGTRIKLLDGLLALAVFGALAVPVGHITLGKFLRKKKERS